MSTEGRTLTISEALKELREEFPDVTISKIRFLEGQGLIEPERNASGYRQFQDSDVQRLVWILRQQRDKFLPLKVIKKALDRGVDIHDAGDGAQPNLFSAVADAAASEEQAAAQAEQRASERADEDGERANAGDKRRHPASPGRASAASAGSAGTVAPNQPTTEPKDSSPAKETAVAKETAATKETVPPEQSMGASDPADDHVPVPAGTESVLEPAGRGRSDKPTVGSEATKETAMPGESDTPKRHSTPADVVAALQEDPRAPAKAQPRNVRQQRPVLALGADDSSQTYTGEELAQAAGISMEMLDDLERYGLVEPVMHGAEVYYDQHCLRVASLAAAGAERGIEARHLRIYKVAAEREAGFIEQLVMPLLKQRNPDSRARALQEAVELAALGAEMHAAVLARELHPDLGRGPAG